MSLGQTKKKTKSVKNSEKKRHNKNDSNLSIILLFSDLFFVLCIIMFCKLIKEKKQNKTDKNE